MSTVVPASYMLRRGWRRPSWIQQQHPESDSKQWPNTPVKVLKPIPLHLPPSVNNSPAAMKAAMCACGLVIRGDPEELEKHRRTMLLRYDHPPCTTFKFPIKAYNRYHKEKGFKPVDQLTNPSYSWLGRGHEDQSPIDTIELLDVEQEVHESPILRLPDMSGFNRAGDDSDVDALICSYSTVAGQPQTYYVPGEPPALALHPGDLSKDLPLILPPKLRTSHRTETFLAPGLHNFDPVFRSLDIMNPGFRFDDIDLLTEAPIIKDMGRWAHGRPMKPCRFNVRLVRDTLILSYNQDRLRDDSWGKQPTTLSLGHAFEAVATSFPKGLEGTDEAGHFRLVRHRLGPFACAIRAENDAVYHAPGTEPQERSDSQDSDPSPCPSFGRGRAIRRGRVIPQNKIAEVKTIAVTNQDDTDVNWDSWSHAYHTWGTTFFTRPSYLYTAHFIQPAGQQHALFHHIQVDDARGIRDVWQKKWHVQGTIRRLAVLLKRLRDAVAKTRHKDCSLIITPHGLFGKDDYAKILLFERDPAMNAQNFISEEDIDRYWDRKF
ncbi:hypothetical protein QBC44DRAFT_328447 [Cladorrhinum sp. PSN332]|nr:hypothetical protein QBC44DRAFT_328447 [Cladorrhinum sp. PSN332]